jgi:hypothetical protein
MFEVKEVNSAEDIRLFHRVADLVYAEDAKYIKPITKDVEEVFDPKKNDAFESGEAKRFVLWSNDTPVGRFAVFYQQKNGGEKMGGMGFFECLPIQDAAFAIFDHCSQWLTAKGCTYMDGPVNFGDRDSFWGLLVEAHTDASYRENYNPPYYRDFFEAYGFEKVIEQSTAEMTPDDFDYERFAKLAERVTKNPRYRFECIRYSQQEKYARDFVEIYNKAWSFHEDFKPMTEEKIMQRFKEIKPAMPEGISVFAYADDKPAGFFINIYELNQVFRKFNGNLGLWNGLRYMLLRNQISKTRGIIFGIVPEYQNLGLETGMIMKFREYFLTTKNLRSAELAWIGDFNPKMLSLLKALGSKTTKIHYTYRKNFS